MVEIAQAANVAVKTLPGLYELISGDLNLAGQIRPVQVEDVLGREPVEVDMGSIAKYLSGETVLVTGAGGSIGAELCRQIARVGPARLVLVEHSEAALFDIERELVGERDFSAVATVLGDCGDRAKMSQVFERYKPGVVFHAAAYKHVALLEANPLEAVRNNTLATRVMADVAVEYGTQRFVLVSTDKAANPKNLLGQSKALCEWIVEAYGHRAGHQHALRRRPLRQRPQLLGQRDPDLPAPDREGRPRHGDPSGDDALLHDDPGSGVARRAGRRDRRPRPGLRARHGRAGEDPRPGGQHDPPLGQGPRDGHLDHVRRRPPGREAARGALDRRRDGRPHRRIRRSSAPPGRPSTPTGSRKRSTSSSGWWNAERPWTSFPG